jgi:hypothetical protein
MVMFPVFPLLVLLVYLGLIIYGVFLASRLVTAVEQIARALAARPPDRPLS